MRAVLLPVLLAVFVLVGCNASATPPAEPNALDRSEAAPTAARAASSALPTEASAGAATSHHTSAEPAAPSPAAVHVSAAEEARYRTVTIPAGTTLSLALQSEVSSKSSAVEDRVNATLRRGIVVDGVTAVPAGATVSGYVTEATRSGRVKGRARVGVRFTSLRAGDGRHDIRTAVISRQARATKKQDAAKIGIGAGAGAVVGAVAGGKKGAAIGSAVGGAGGTGVVLATRGEEVTLARGSVVTTRLTAPITVRVRLP
jgi:hypothetical protein